MLEEKKIPPMIKRLIKRKKFKGLKKEDIEKYATPEEKKIIGEAKKIPAKDNVRTLMEKKYWISDVANAIVFYLMSDTKSAQKALKILENFIKTHPYRKGLDEVGDVLQYFMGDMSEIEGIIKNILNDVEDTLVLKTEHL